MIFEWVETSPYVGIVFTVGAYMAGVALRSRWMRAWSNPLLLAVILILAGLSIFQIPYESYAAGADYISIWLTPTTVCLAIPLYERLELLKKHAWAIVAGIGTAVLTSMGLVWLWAVLLDFEHAEYVTFLPKSITTAIGMVISEELGGYVPITVAVIVFTGIFGSMVAEPVCRMFRITEPVAKGLAIGSAAHGIGTSKAMEMGKTEGAVSGLAMVLSGVVTVFAAMLFAQFTVTM